VDAGEGQLIFAGALLRVKNAKKKPACFGRLWKVSLAYQGLVIPGFGVA
jgi:hypothetical protein